MGEGERLADRDRDPGPERLMVALKMNHQLHRGSWGGGGGDGEIEEGGHM